MSEDSENEFVGRVTSRRSRASRVTRVPRAGLPRRPRAFRPPRDANPAPSANVHSAPPVNANPAPAANVHSAPAVNTNPAPAANDVNSARVAAPVAPADNSNSCSPTPTPSTTFPFPVGTFIARDFGDAGIFSGTISTHYPDAPELCEVTYTDGDKEDLDKDQVHYAVALFKQQFED